LRSVWDLKNKTLKYIQMGNKSTNVENSTTAQTDANTVLADSAVFSKEQVIRIVAEFGRTYNTEAFLGNGETLEQAIEEVKDLIKWDA